MSHLTTVRKGATKRRAIIGALSLLLVVLLVAAACGEDATPTPLAATAVPATSVPDVPPTAVPDEPDVPATSVPDVPATSVPVPTATAAPTTGLRAMSEWTVENPATLAEIEAELENYRGESLVFASWGGAYQAAQREAYIIPFTAKFGIDIVEDSPVEYPKISAMA